MCGRFCQMAGWPKKSGRGQGGRKAGFHSISDGVPVSINGCINITSLKFLQPLNLVGGVGERDATG